METLTLVLGMCGMVFSCGRSTKKIAAGEGEKRERVADVIAM